MDGNLAFSIQTRQIGHDLPSIKDNNVNRAKGLLAMPCTAPCKSGDVDAGPK